MEGINGGIIMTVNDLSEMADVSKAAMKRAIRKVYPYLMVSGKETLLTRNQAMAALQQLRLRQKVWDNISKIFEIKDDSITIIR